MHKIKLSARNTEAFNYFSDHVEDAVVCSELVENAHKAPLHIDTIIEKLKLDPTSVHMYVLNKNLLSSDASNNEICNSILTHSICKHFSKAYYVTTYLLIVNILSFRDPQLYKTIIEYEKKNNPDFAEIQKERISNEERDLLLS